MYGVLSRQMVERKRKGINDGSFYKGVRGELPVEQFNALGPDDKALTGH